MSERNLPPARSNEPTSGAERPPAAESATERINARTTDLDRQPLGTILERILDEDAAVPQAVRAALPALERAAEALHRTLADGGRWFNVGAGTSGRIALLDAVELPPTFGTDPERVQTVMAGGREALERAVEGAEDDREGAREALQARGVSARDAVVALSASGRTPFAVAAAEHARSVGAVSIAITCDPSAPLVCAVEIPIVVEVGPEVIAGSTRMKGGLAQKMVLHALSTSVMVRLGRVRGNLMSEIRMVNSKLRRRAIRVIARLAHTSLAEAELALAEAGGSVSRALDQLGVPRRLVR